MRWWKIVTQWDFFLSICGMSTKVVFSKEEPILVRMSKVEAAVIHKTQNLAFNRIYLDGPGWQAVSHMAIHMNG